MPDSSAPSSTLYIGDVQMSNEVSGHIVRLEAELTRDISDQLTLTLLNPLNTKIGVGDSQGEYLYVDSKAFQPGQEITAFIGYGGDNAFITRGVITKYLPSFPKDGMPRLTIKALDASVYMMESADGMLGRTWPDMSYSDIVTQIIKEYGFDVGEIEPTPTIRKTAKKTGISDYKFVKGLANLLGFEFKVKWDPITKKWKVYWRTPKPFQQKRYTFTYLNGPESTLLSFEPQFGLRDVSTEVKVLYFDSITRTWEEMAVKEEKYGEGITFTGSERMEREITSSTKIRIDAGGQSVEVIPERPFSCAEDAHAWATRWLQSRKDNFIMGNGTCIGVETLQPGQVHTLLGLGKQLSGDYEFTTVRHIVDRDKGYTTEFFANKVVNG